MTKEFHKLEIKGGPSLHELDVTLDGVPLRNLQYFALTGDLRNPNQVVIMNLQILCEVVVDVLATE